MLSFEEKLAICSSYPELERKDVSLGRVNFHYEDSAHDKKTVVYHLHPNGNGFVFAGMVPDVKTDDKGLVNIREYSAEELRSLIGRSIRSLARTDCSETADMEPAKAEGANQTGKEQWEGPGGSTLTLHFEDELWYVYAGLNLDAAFETREEAEEYLREEGFKPAGAAFA